MTPNFFSDTGFAGTSAARCLLCTTQRLAKTAFSTHPRRSLALAPSARWYFQCPRPRPCPKRKMALSTSLHSLKLPQVQGGVLNTPSAVPCPRPKRETAFSMPSPSPHVDGVLTHPRPHPKCEMAFSTHAPRALLRVTCARSDLLVGVTRPSAWLRPCTRDPSFLPHSKRETACFRHTTY